jgi:hypothetical protein
MAKSKQLLDADLIRAYLNGDYDGGKIRPLTAAEARSISSLRASGRDESQFQRQADVDAEAKDAKAANQMPRRNRAQSSERSKRSETGRDRNITERSSRKLLMLRIRSTPQ